MVTGIYIDVVIGKKVLIQRNEMSIVQTANSFNNGVIEILICESLIKLNDSLIVNGLYIQPG